MGLCVQAKNTDIKVLSDGNFHYYFSNYEFDPKSFFLQLKVEENLFF